jgi:hypothetical protein
VGKEDGNECFEDSGGEKLSLLSGGQAVARTVIRR